jgi:PKD repeat protein
MPDQAPLAKFIADIQLPGIASTFDASASVSPTGTLSNYSWDFGDGNTLDTSNPLTEHVYTLDGTYTVTLTVTNSAGTSTSQLFNYNDTNNSSGTTYPLPMTNNGGESATVSQVVTIDLLAPTNGSGQKITNRFPFEVEWYNQLNWSSTINSSAIGYNIRRNGTLIARAYPNTQYKDHNRPQKKTDVYTVTSVNASGNESTPLTITVSQ